MDQTKTLGHETRIILSDQAARWLIGATDFTMKKLGQEEFDLDEFIQSLAEAGVTPEADVENDLYQLAKEGLISRKLFNRNLVAPAKEFDQSKLNNSILCPPSWMLGYIEQMKQAGPMESDRIFRDFKSAYPESVAQFNQWLNRTSEDREKTEAQAYGYLMGMVQMNILDADHAGELMEDYRPGRKYNP